MERLSEKDLRVVVISGLSGSGKSTAAKALEDLGFFCVDNLPPQLIATFLDLCLHSSGTIGKVALVVDVREQEFLKEFPQTFRSLRQQGYRLELIFLDSADEALVRRFQETRRRHPLLPEKGLLEAIQREREVLKELRRHADRILDTSTFTVHRLRQEVTAAFGRPSDGAPMSVGLISFGYRYGPPAQADIVIDIRFLPNPNFVENLRSLAGTDRAVREYVLRAEDAKGFVERFLGMLDFLIPLYAREGKAYLTIGVGCTGGRHRSVAMVEELRQHLAKRGLAIQVEHRDLGRVV